MQRLAGMLKTVLLSKKWLQTTLGQESIWMGNCLGTPSAADKNQRQELLREHISQVDGLQISFEAWSVFQAARI